MDEIKSAISLNQDMSFEEAERYFKGKIPITFDQFKKISAEYQSRAFTVSGYTKLRVIKKFYDELLIAIEEGTTKQSFADRMNEYLKVNFYEEMTGFETDNIFRTNVQTAYQVGHYERMTDPDVKALRPYWMYDAVQDSHTRATHLAMNGKVFPADDPVWDIWYPPNGFRCRCNVVTLSRRQVEAMAIEVESGMPKPAELGDGRFVNVVPDRNFHTNPAKAPFSPDLKGYPEPLVKAYENRSRERDQGG